jgi:hypothetical protein
MWHIDDNFFLLKIHCIINDLTHNIYVVSFGWPSEVISSLTLERHKWLHRHAENEQMDGEKQEHTSVKQHTAVSNEIWRRETCSANISVAIFVSE